MPVRVAGQPPVFVGRARELSEVGAVIERARAGQASALLVTGDAGVGKSALVHHALAGVGDDALVLSGGSLPLGSMSVPFLALRHALRRLPAGIPPPPLMGEAAASVPVEFDAWVDEVCATRPVVLFVDDLHWSDQSTLDVLMYLLAGPRDRGLAVLSTLRRGEVAEGHPLNTWLADVRRLPGCQELPLGPLTRFETREQVAGLLGTVPHETLVNEVYARTRGNSYLNRLLVAGLDPDVAHLPASLPDDLQGALMANWHRLSTDAREITKVLAVGGSRLTAGELGKVLQQQRSFADLRGLLREAVDVGVLDIDDLDGTYWFHHPLQAELMERQLPADERRAWHETFAAYIEARLDEDSRDDVAVLAALADHHFHANHPEEAYAWSLRAAEAAGQVGGASERIRLLRRALDLRGRLPTVTETREELLWRLRAAAAEAADHTSELEALDELIALTDPHTSPAVAAELVIRRMHVRFSLGQGFISPEETARAAEMAAAEPDSWQYALAVAEQSHAALWAGEDATAAEFADRGLAAAERAGHPRALSHARTAQSAMALLREDYEQAFAWADRAREAALEADDFWAYVHAVLWEANAIDCSFSEEVIRHKRRRRLEAEAVGCPHPYLSWIAADEAMGLLGLGSWGPAAELVRMCLGSEPGHLVDVMSRLNAARLAALQGRPDEARAHLERADELFADLSGFKPFAFDAVRADVLLAAGDAEEALASAMNGIDLEGAAPTMAEWLVPLAARAIADLTDGARRMGGEGLQAALARMGALEARFPPRRLDVSGGTIPEPPLPLVFDGATTQPQAASQVDAMADWYLAESGRAHRSRNNAAQWQTAAHRLAAAHLPWETAYAWYRAGEALLRQSRPDHAAAASALRTSSAIAQELRAMPVLDLVRELATAARISLDDVAARSAPHAQASIAGLTPREEEILRHLVAGRTYAEIAGALFLSEKTVSSHISNMLRKTGAANRVELAQFARSGAGSSRPAG
ncbi:MAG TPA: AAA family ATPase [Dermatophilaceae bacterium]|nr:AAA family ATPase [Dermatophilaceae bacterium]